MELMVHDIASCMQIDLHSVKKTCSGQPVHKHWVEALGRGCDSRNAATPNPGMRSIPLVLATA